jgi:hypothetical protein
MNPVSSASFLLPEIFLDYISLRESIRDFYYSNKDPFVLLYDETFVAPADGPVIRRQDT